MNLKFILDDLSEKISEVIKNSPAKDIEKNIKALIHSGLSKLDLVNRDEFEIQQKILLNLDEKITTLENRIQELEQKNKK